jgi:hypothetical protein
MPDTQGGAPDTLPMQSWQSNRTAYIRSHVYLAVFGALVATAVLVFIGSPYPWVGVVGAFLAIGVRGALFASREIGQRWQLTADRLSCSDGRSVALRDIASMRRLGSAIQIVTGDGARYLIRYLPDPDAARASIEAAMHARDGGTA